MQFKHLFYKRLLIALIFSICGQTIFAASSTRTSAASENSSHRAAYDLIKNGVGVASAAFAGWVGYKYILGRPKLKPKVELSPEDEHDRKFKEILDKGLPPELVEEVTSYIPVKQQELCAYQEREQLLPAVVPNYSKAMFFRYTAEISHVYQGYATKSQAFRRRFEERGPRAISIACFTGEPFSLPLTQQQSNPDIYHLIHSTQPAEILGNNPLADEYVLIGFTNGKIQLHLHDAARRALNSLTNEQSEFIKSLYDLPKSKPIKLSWKQTSIFNSLSPAIQNCLKTNYTFEFTTMVSVMQSPVTQFLIGCGLLCFEAFRIPFSKTNFEWDRREVNLKISLACLAFLGARIPLSKWVANSDKEDDNRVSSEKSRSRDKMLRLMSNVVLGGFFGAWLYRLIEAENFWAKNNAMRLDSYKRGGWTYGNENKAIQVLRS